MSAVMLIQSARLESCYNLLLYTNMNIERKETKKNYHHFDFMYGYVDSRLSRLSTAKGRDSMFSWAGPSKV